MGALNKMHLELLRFSSGKESTLGLLMMVKGGQRHFCCFTLEDQFQERKVADETRIPEGVYKIGVRPPDEGNVNKEYSKRFPSIHKGMLWLQDVPNFSWIYIHCGNNDDHTSGCILVGDTLISNTDENRGFLGESVKAYKELYPELIEEALRGNLTIAIYNYEDVDYSYSLN